MQIVPLRPNPRQRYQDSVNRLCSLLRDGEGAAYRVDVFRLLAIKGHQHSRSGITQFRRRREARLFLRDHPADTRALSIMDELDRIYAASPDEIDELRGAVVEVFTFMVCRKFYSNADIEVKVSIGSWDSGSIDTAGCDDGKGHCFQGKVTLASFASVIHQKSDLDEINQRTKGTAKGFFVTTVHRDAFLQTINARGLDPSQYAGVIYDRADLLVLENRILDSSTSVS